MAIHDAAIANRDGLVGREWQCLVGGRARLFYIAPWKTIDAKDTVTLARYGRFLAPIASRILAPLVQAERAAPPGQRGLSPRLEAARSALRPVYDAQWKSAHPRCAAVPAVEDSLTRAR